MLFDHNVVVALAHVARRVLHVEQSRGLLVRFTPVVRAAVAVYVVRTPLLQSVSGQIVESTIIASAFTAQR